MPADTAAGPDSRTGALAVEPAPVTHQLLVHRSGLSVRRATRSAPGSGRFPLARQLALARRLARARGLGQDVGMTTAEYAIGTLAACGFAALLVTVLKGGEVQSMLLAIIKKALALGD